MNFACADPFYHAALDINSIDLYFEAWISQYACRVRKRGATHSNELLWERLGHVSADMLYAFRRPIIYDIVMSGTGAASNRDGATGP